MIGSALADMWSAPNRKWWWRWLVLLATAFAVLVLAPIVLCCIALEPSRARKP